MNSFVCAVEVGSYEALHEKIMEAGRLAAFPKPALPRMAWRGLCKDPDGKVLGVHQPDLEAQ